MRRGQLARRVPDRLCRRALRGPRPVPGALRVRQHDGRAARHGRGQRPDLRRLPGDGHGLAHGGADHRAARGARCRQHRARDKLSKIRDYLQAGCRDRTGSLTTRAPGCWTWPSLRAKSRRRRAAVYFENPLLPRLHRDAGRPRSRSIAHAARGAVRRQRGPDLAGRARPAGRVRRRHRLRRHPAAGHAHAVRRRSRRLHRHRDEPKFVMEYPSRLFGIAPTAVEGEYGFGDVAYERTSFAVREEGKEWVGTAAALWGITAGRLPGADGAAGHGRDRRGDHAASPLCHAEDRRRSRASKSRFRGPPHFKEFVVNFDGTGKTVAADQPGAAGARRSSAART